MNIRFPTKHLAVGAIVAVVGAVAGANCTANVGDSTADSPVGKAAQAIDWQNVYCPLNEIISASNQDPTTGVFPGNCPCQSGWLSLANSDGAIANMLAQCNDYCGQSYGPCVGNLALNDIENSLVCYNQEAGHRWWANCVCGMQTGTSITQDPNNCDSISCQATCVCADGTVAQCSASGGSYDTVMCLPTNDGQQCTGVYCTSDLGDDQQVNCR